MTVEDRNAIYEAVDILRALGGNNGFIVDKDVQFGKSMTVEEFNGETVYN